MSVIIGTCLGWNAETISASAGCIAAVALVPAAFAAWTAANSFRLESSPYIVMADGREIDRKATAAGTPLREIDYCIVSNRQSPNDLKFGPSGSIQLYDENPSTGAQFTPGYSAIPTAKIAVRNIGRSPAIRLELAGRLEWDPAREAAHIVFKIDALPPGDIILNVANYSAVAVTFSATHALDDSRQRRPGKAARWGKRKLQFATLAIFSLAANLRPMFDSP